MTKPEMGKKLHSHAYFLRATTLSKSFTNFRIEPATLHISKNSSWVLRIFAVCGALSKSFQHRFETRDFVCLTTVYHSCKNTITRFRNSNTKMTNSTVVTSTLFNCVMEFFESLVYSSVAKGRQKPTFYACAYSYASMCVCICVCCVRVFARTWKNENTWNFQIQLTFPEIFKLQRPNECDANFVDIFKEYTDMSSMQKHFCGSIADTVIISANIAYLRFYAEPKAINSTFEAVMTAVRDKESSEKRESFQIHNNRYIYFRLNAFLE